MVLNDFFKKCAFEKIGKNVLGAQAIELPELFISKDGRQWLHPGDGNDLKYNIVKIDPNVGDQGILGNHVIARDINKSDLELIRKYEMVGFNTGYELIRRLIVSLEKGVWIDPSKEQQLLGVDNYPLKTVEEMWRAGVPKYQ
ncbi:hypothetical protein K788_00013045 [Paraburkholderia caribensis MBA4]|uniref:Uncharacterized protein n=2 Tax=Paraburkholderia caribensis TaxID=75105 RepID=A0A0P0RA24_9BURK|nr:hypothetical protein K788_00013045 [Paraburkholderia caribensis MBA4]